MTKESQQISFKKEINYLYFLLIPYPMNTTALFSTQGYLYFPHFYADHELAEIESILLHFHNQWIKEHQDEYEKRLINSHSITSSSFITERERLALFEFITQAKLREVIGGIFPEKALFLNTQLFFDPYNPVQKNYWHRDIQYTGMSLAEQKESIKTQQVIHFRIPFRAEEGIELIAGTHREWDVQEEEDTRLCLNGKTPSDPLARGKQIKLNRGDLLVFSANMIHRGLYGNNRLAFDLVFCDDHPHFRSFIDSNNHPSSAEKQQLNHTDFFL